MNDLNKDILEEIKRELFVNVVDLRNLRLALVDQNDDYELIDEVLCRVIRCVLLDFVKDVLKEDYKDGRE